MWPEGGEERAFVERMAEALQFEEYLPKDAAKEAAFHLTD